MKNLIFSILLLFSFISFAQSPDVELLSYEGQSFGRSFPQRLEKTREVLELAERVAADKGINTQRIQLKNREGQTYPALQISIHGSSLQNLEAARVARTMSQLPLVLSPYDLSFGSSAFFDPDGSKLGVPYTFLIEGITNSSYLHELYHAETYLKVLNNQHAIWAGVMGVLDGTFISTHNTQYYFRFASLDELSATALSVKLDAQYLLELRNSLTPFEYNRSRGVADQRLGSLYLNILAGRYLAKQVVDVTTRSLDIHNQAKIQIKKLTLGKLTKTIYETVFLIDSYTREFVNGRGSYVPKPEGVRFTLYSATAPKQTDLKNRLLEIRSRAMKAEKLFAELEKKVHVVIQYPDIERTDVRGLETLADGPFDVLD